MDNKEIRIASNIKYFRDRNHWTLEELAEKVGVSRQALAKWEQGKSLPDVVNCARLAQVYEIPVDELLWYNPESAATATTKGKHFFGTVILGESGVPLSTEARQAYGLADGSQLTLLGNEIGLALVPEGTFVGPLHRMMAKLK